MCLNCVTLPASSSTTQLHSSAVRRNHGPWAEVLENWITTESNNSRTSRAMKIGDKTVTVSTKISTTNKRDVSETDLYLLGTRKQSYKKFINIII